jgi:hypothetical protein
MAMPRRFIRKNNWEFGGQSAPEEGESGEPKSRKRRLATTLVFTTLFFAGASLAAVAGNQLSPLSGEDQQQLAAEAHQAVGDTTTTDATATPPATEDASASTAASVDAGARPADASSDATTAADPAAAVDESVDQLTPDPTPPPNPAAASTPDASAADADTAAPKLSAKAAAKAARGWKKTKLRTILLPKLKPAPAPEIEGPASAATIWLNSQLPDPTPPALRLSPKFASNLKATAKAAGLDWATMLGILRARGAAGHDPADRTTLRKLATRLASSGPAKGDWARMVSYSGDTSFADRAAALARYDRAVGLSGLVKGLEAAKKSIATRLLSDRNVSIYEGGRNDIVQNKVDVRVLTLIAYLRESFGQVTVSSLVSGHRLYARPGVVSAHIPGHAVDISGLGDTPIQGHQEPGGVTERAVRDLLFLPSEVMPRQIISLLGMGGASFPLADHYNHIHIGF